MPATLTADALDCLLAEPDVEQFDLMFRVGGGRWNKVARVVGYAAGLRLMTVPGAEYWFKRTAGDDDTGPSLFDDISPDTVKRG